ncbi:carboxymuconolactone decarboxylase family protein [bacterium]|nr:carboxymuconolactone decarboxylase family protein [bacterium]
MAHKLPNAYQSFQEQYPDVFNAYNQLGSAVHSQGPLEETTRDLVKLALAIGIGSEGAVHSHTRKALASGATPEEIRQVVLLSLPTIGFPKMMAALTWVEDILK